MGLWPPEFRKSVTTWPQLPPEHPLSRFNTKFWGRPEDVDRTEWRATHAERLAPMGPDWSTKHEIKSTCYVLDIGIEELGVDKIWVRADYDRVYRWIEKHRNWTTEPILRPSSAVVTGSPGIGKRYWVIYALRRRLGKQEETVWYRDNKVYLFSDLGVREVPLIPPAGFVYSKPWLFIDFHDAPDGVPPELVEVDTPYFVIWSASPPEIRWFSICKNTNPGRCVLNPWTREEIHEVAALRFQNPDLEKINQVYDNYGHTPFLCIDLVADKERLEEYQNSVDNLISSLSWEAALSMVRSVQALQPVSGAEKLFVIRRTGDNVDSCHSDYTCDVMALPFYSKLAGRIRKGAVV